jgi:hypothetical protein
MEKRCSNCKSYLTDLEIEACGGMCAECEFYSVVLMDDDSLEEA